MDPLLQKVIVDMDFFKKNEPVSQQEIDDALSPLDDMISSNVLAHEPDETDRDLKVNVSGKTIEGIPQPFGRVANSVQAPLSSRLFEKNVEETQFSPVSARPSRPAPPIPSFAAPAVLPPFPASMARPTPYADPTPVSNLGPKNVEGARRSSPPPAMMSTLRSAPPPPMPSHRSAPPPSMSAHNRTLRHSAPPPSLPKVDDLRIDDYEDVTSYRPNPVSRRGSSIPAPSSSAYMSDVLRSDHSTGEPSVIPAPPSTVHGLAMSVNSERVRSPKRSMKGWAAAFVSVGVLGGAAAGLVLHFEQAKLAAAAMADQTEMAAPAAKVSLAAAAPALHAESAPAVPAAKPMAPIEATPAQDEAPSALLSNFVQPSSAQVQPSNNAGSIKSARGVAAKSVHDVPAVAQAPVSAKAEVAEVKKPATVRSTRSSSKVASASEQESGGKLMAVPQAAEKVERADKPEKKEKEPKADPKAEAKAAKKNVSATEANELAKQQLEAALGGSD